MGLAEEMVSSAAGEKPDNGETRALLRDEDRRKKLVQ